MVKQHKVCTLWYCWSQARRLNTRHHGTVLRSADNHGRLTLRALSKSAGALASIGVWESVALDTLPLLKPGKADSTLETGSGEQEENRTQDPRLIACRKFDKIIPGKFLIVLTRLDVDGVNQTRNQCCVRSQCPDG